MPREDDWDEDYDDEDDWDDDYDDDENISGPSDFFKLFADPNKLFKSKQFRRLFKDVFEKISKGLPPEFQKL